MQRRVVHLLSPYGTNLTDQIRKKRSFFFGLRRPLLGWFTFFCEGGGFQKVEFWLVVAVIKTMR